MVSTITDKSSGFIQFGTPGNDSASGISIDRNGNVYLIGTTSGDLSGNGNLGGSDAFVAKYDSQGNQLWVKQFGSSGNDYRVLISTDDNGNTYVKSSVASSIANGDSTFDDFVYKYDTYGNQLQRIKLIKFWPGASLDAISTDSSGNLLIGLTDRPYKEDDYRFGQDISSVLKFDLGSNEVWNRPIDLVNSNSHIETEYVKGISTDSSGNSYILGSAAQQYFIFSPPIRVPGDNRIIIFSVNSPFSGDIIAKYDASGKQLWFKLVENKEYFAVIGKSKIELDLLRLKDEEILLTVIQNGKQEIKSIRLKDYKIGAVGQDNEPGALIFRSFSSHASKISTDSSGNSYVVFKEVSIDGLGRIEKYDANGNRLWVSEFDSCDPDLSQGISTDNNGNIYVTGYTNVAKYATNGIRLWIKNFSTSENDKATGISTDSSGNVYISGYTTGSLPGNINLGGSDAFIFKFDSDGNQLNNDGLPCIKLSVSPNEVIEDENGNLVYTFTRTGSLGNAATVSYTIGGTATNGTDYTTIPASVTFLANSAIATVIVDPIADTSLELDEAVSLTLNSGAAYTIGTKGAVLGTIVNDEAVVTLSVSPDNVPEDGLGNLAYTFTRTGYLANPLTVSYTISGTAINGTDYATISTSVTFLANSSIATVIVDPTDDTKVEPDETVILSLQENNNYYIGTPSPVLIR